MSQQIARKEPLAPEDGKTHAAPDLHLVEDGRRETADPAQQRLAFHRRCAQIVFRLERMSFEDRLALYGSGEASSRELSTAAALWPDAMPTLNGEFEWIAVTLVDNLD